MRQLRISMEREGMQVPVGTISGNTPADACFAYDADYLEREDAVSISVMLPLQEAAFDPDRTRRYFDGLLPEGFTRRCVAQWLREEEGDYLSLLAGLGQAMAMKRLDRLADGLEGALRDAADELTQHGLPGVRDLRESILEKGGYRNL